MELRPHIDFWIGDAAPESAGADAHNVPADVLARVLEQAQRAIHLLAMAETGREIKQRVRIPEDVRQQFQLVCHVAQPGSYVQPATLEGVGDLFTPQRAEHVLSAFKEVGQALSRREWHTVSRLLPDRGLRLRVAEAYQQMMPDPGSRLVVALRNGVGEIARFDADTGLYVRDMLRDARMPEGSLAEPATLTGEVIRIDFAQRKLTIRHHPSQRAIDCEYTDELEDMLVESRREWVQVSGLVELDKKDRPTRLTDVFEIRPIDLSPFVLETVEGEARTLRFRDGARSFNPVLDETGTLFVVEDVELGVHAYAESRADLLDMVREELEVVWLEYAEADPDTLTPAAARLRDAVRTILEPAADAPTS